MIPQLLILGMCAVLSVRGTDLTSISVVNHNIEFRSAEERLMMLPIQHNVFRHRHFFLRHFLTQSSTLHYGPGIFDFRLQTCAGDAVAQQNVTNLGKVLEPLLWADTACLIYCHPFLNRLHLKAGAVLILRDVKKDFLMPFLYPESSSLLWLQNLLLFVLQTNCRVNQNIPTACAGIAMAALTDSGAGFCW